jgi:hypothetical protein
VAFFVVVHHSAVNASTLVTGVREQEKAASEETAKSAKRYALLLTGELATRHTC